MRPRKGRSSGFAIRKGRPWRGKQKQKNRNEKNKGEREGGRERSL
jgi:hypothetical protein